MALFDFLRRFSFFKGRDTAGLKEEDLDFAKWINAHRDWRRRLTNYIQGASQEELDENVVCLDNRCDLGKWIYGNGGHFYGEIDIFRRLRDHHTDFHRSAGKVVRIYKSDGRDAATKALHTDFDMFSLKVVKNLETLEREVKG